MALGEFDLIARYFTRPGRATGAATVLGIGDDCALLAPTPGRHWAVSTDLLIEGRHFLPTVAPERLGHKALAVNLSDLAACGADPVAFTLALSMPRVDEAFLAGLSRGLWALADRHAIALVGGDTTAGPLSLCITVMGEVPVGQALRRDGARPGDTLWVSHEPDRGLGDARLALEVFRGHESLPGDAFDRVRLAMECPQPRLALGQGLRGVATAAIDLSDGLVGDLRHVLARSGVGARLLADAVPVSADLAGRPLATRRRCTLAGGDDYELLFTAPPERNEAVHAAAHAAGVAATAIGTITPGRELAIVDARGQTLAPQDWSGFDHFSA